MDAFVREGPTNDAVVRAEVPVPETGGQEVLVRVHAFGVGIHDRYFIPSDIDFPYVIGIEGAGVVAKVGSEVSGINSGERVLFSNSLNPKGGTWGEFTVVDQTAIIAMPDGLGFPAASAIPVAGGTALECLHTLGLNRGDTLFVAGASGAIGTMVLQLAAAGGVRTAGSASVQNHDYLRELGAELAVDYNAPEWQEEVNRWAPGGVDAALAIQPGTGIPSQFVVRKGGRVVTVSGDQFEPERNVLVEQFRHRTDSRSDRNEMVEAVAAGRIKVVLEHVYPFEEAVAALEKTETRHARGKLVVTGP